MVNDCEHAHSIFSGNFSRTSALASLFRYLHKQYGYPATAGEQVIAIGSSAVPISLASKEYQEAKDGLTKQTGLLPILLPDIPKIPFQITEVLKYNPNLYKTRNQKQYNFSSPFFSVCVLTPPEGHNQFQKLEDKQSRQKRAKEAWLARFCRLCLSSSFGTGCVLLVE